MSEEDTPTRPPEARDRRGQPRCEPRGGVEVTCRAGRSGQGPDFALALLDLSMAGARLMVRDALPLGRVVEVCLYPESRSGGLRLTARVVWCHPVQGGHHFVGVKFETPLTADAYESLRQLRGAGPS
jgi:hypothetical protein